jgi:hypothetical protein|tara:strand:+ start:732 stop:929 length:198 start_codon:yes stop_codon:yes gene_type:complete
MDKIKKTFIEECQTKKMFDMLQLLAEVEDRGRLLEIIHTSLIKMKLNPKNTPIDCLREAIDVWDI